MKIGSDGAPRPAEAPKRMEKPAAQAQGTAASGSAGKARAFDDNATIMGIPDNELTPRVRDAIMTLMAEVDKLRQSLKDMAERLSHAEEIADQDPLLPVYNRRAFVRELTRVQASVERYRTEASLVYLDLNQFKSVNDQLGHEAGDYVLSQVALRLKDSVRDTDIVGRLGGDEFGVILSRTRPEDARYLIDRLPKLFAENPIIWKGAALPTSLSTGIVPIHAGSSPEQTLSAADSAMYEDKRTEDDLLRQ